MNMQVILPLMLVFSKSCQHSPKRKQREKRKELVVWEILGMWA